MVSESSMAARLQQMLRRGAEEVSDMDFTALLFAAAGAVLGGAVGLLLGLWLASRSAAK